MLAPPIHPLPFSTPRTLLIDDGPALCTRTPPSFPPTTFRAPSFHLSGTTNFPSFFSQVSHTMVGL